MGGGSYRAEAAIFPSGFVTQNVFTGLDLPTQVRFAPDGRVFIAEKNGRLLEFDSITDTSAKVVIDRSSAVYGWWDRGFLGLALDPDFSTSPYVYMLYTTDVVPYGDACPSPPGGNTDGCLANGRLSRVKVDAGSNLVGSEEVLLEGNWCQQYPSHSIGSLQFGDDGALYVSAGDGASFTFADWGQGGSAGSPTPENPCGDPPLPVGGQQQSPPNAEGGALRSQDLRTPGDPVSFDGTVLRVNKATGAAMPDNPLIGGDSGDDRIIAYGLRNPFRITARPGTNEIWVGDVGWSIWEEINRITSPTDATVENFGWPCYEGAGRNSAYDGSDLAICENLYGDAGAHTAPLFSFRHSSTMAGCAPGTSSLSGLAFYEGGDYPAEYNGALFIADYSRQCIWAMMPGADGEPSNLTLFADSTPSVALEIGPGGDLYSVDLLGGKVVRFRYPGANDAPTAVVGADRTAGQAPLTVAFDGTGSSDPDGDPMTYRWDLDGDGQYDDSTAVNPSFTYTTPGTYNVGLEVSDEWGGVDTDGVVITATTAPVATITSPSASSKWKVDQQVTFVGTGNDAEDGALPAGAMSWQLVIQHCSSPSSCHGHPLQQWTGVASGSFVAPDHEYPSYLELTLTVTDSVGATGSSTIRLDPATTVLSFTSTPAGLKLTVGGSEQVTPFTRTVIVGSQISVQAANPQTVNQRTYRFASW
ncbi:MAG TPA: PQQ-dependent sugar dehydrogenase, partial [Acidimicrobiia bacterium]